MPVAQESRVIGYRFDSFEVDLVGARLLRAAEPIHLEPKVFRLLVALIEGRGAVVHKEELLSLVWGEAFVTENVLTRAIARLRKALDDDAHDPNYIETAHTLGYRFLGRVEVLGGESTARPAESTTAGPISTGGWNGAGWRRRATVALLAALGLLVVVLSWLAERGTRLPDSTVRRPQEPRRLAVLPFDNLGPAEQANLVSGLHETLLGNLARIPELRVISRRSAIAYGEKKKSVPVIGRELEVDYVIEGSALYADGQVRITAQLIDAATDEHLWAAEYDRDLENVLVLLSEVASTIALQVESVLRPEQIDLLAPGPIDPEAQEAYLTARHFHHRWSRDAFDKAVTLYQRALEIDPELAPAWAGLAEALLMRQAFPGRPPTQAVVRRAEKAARRALALDPRLDEAHCALGMKSLFFDWQWDAAGSSLRRALELNPSNSLAHHLYGDYLTVMGRAEEGLAHVERGRQLDPVSPLAIRPVATHLLFARRYPEAAAECRRVLVDHPAEMPGLAFELARALWLEGKRDAALDALEEALARDAEALEVLRSARRAGGPVDVMRTMADFHAGRDARRLSSLTLAHYYARGDDPEAALDWLELAVEERQGMVILLRASPEFDLLHDHPRFERLIARVGLP